MVHRARSSARTALRRSGRLAGIALAGCAGLGLVVAAVPPASAAGSPGPYVALGDSYSAGSGIWPPDPAASPLCVRSSSSYPHVIARATGASLTDVTCAGAETRDFSSAQYPGVPAQLGALRATTRLVTLTIGGNDNNTFVDAILACGAAGAATLGFGAPCKAIYGNTFTNQGLTSTYPAVKKALQNVHAKAPNARVAILAYPQIVPNDGVGCFLSMPIARGDLSYLNDLETTLNGVVRRAASETGTAYVDTWTGSVGHDACKRVGTRYIEPLLFGTNIIPVHPNALGETFMANTTMSTLGLR